MTTKSAPLPVSDEQLAFISRPDAEIAQSVATLSFDKEKMNKRLSGDSWALVVQAHLYHDHILTLMLAENLAKPKALTLDRLSFANKMELARAMALVPEALASFWKKLNKVRNSIAHDLDFELTDDEVQALKRALPDYLITAGGQHERETGLPLSLRDVLALTIFSADKQRQHLAAARLISGKYNLMLQATAAHQEFPLDP